jgi:branched-chain amino acid transport system ATP-binding protein
VPPALELREVSAAYGRFRALFGVSLSVAAGSVTALVGPNGAGKSTIARVATGLVPVTAGRILLAGDDVTGLPTWKLVRRGVAHAPEGRSVFATLDVEDNLRLTFLRALDRQGAADGLAPRVVDDVYRALREIRDAGTSLLVIEQQLPRALELAEQVVVLRKGRVVEAGPVDELGDLARELLPDPRENG